MPPVVLLLIWKRTSRLSVALQQPVYNARDEIVAAISVASTTTYMSLARLEELAPYVKSCAEEISAELGWGKHVRKDK